jgi:RNA polymerase primary sigma factor
MTVGELHELDEVKMLVARGQEAGLLTFSQIATALAEVELEEGDIEEVHLVLERAEIELPLRSRRRRRARARRRRRRWTCVRT